MGEINLVKEISNSFDYWIPPVDRRNVTPPRGFYFASVDQTGLPMVWGNYKKIVQDETNSNYLPYSFIIVNTRQIKTEGTPTDQEILDFCLPILDLLTPEKCSYSDVEVREMENAIEFYLQCIRMVNPMAPAVLNNLKEKIGKIWEGYQIFHQTWADKEFRRIEKKIQNLGNEGEPKL
ncbi:MAG: hypothetical protein PHE43_04265 [Candidatus Nanoarchaeia archaeon]|nr:hypothetical protein [Candidatus Nanoarchaeia archaeon]